MNIDVLKPCQWSESVFGKIELKDKRLTKRLVKIGTQLSSAIGASLSKSCNGNEALVEGSYRFLRNEKIQAEQIARGGYSSTANLAKDSDLLLAIEDTTSIVYGHKVSKELGSTTNKPNAKYKGFLVHSTLLMDAEKERTLGLISQNRWCRTKGSYGKRSNRVKRSYREKESYKWEKNSRDLVECLGDKVKDTLSVCDRDADVYEYIQYKLENKQRFIVRACHDRRLNTTKKTLFEQLPEATLLGVYSIEIAQKANRKKRQAELELRAMQFSLKPPERRNGEQEKLKPITLNVVYVREKTTAEGLEWILLTTEKIDSFKKARQITRYYELRWRIEDFHKAWKSGVKVEDIRMQSVSNLEKMVVILSFVAIRLLQLKEYFEQDNLECPEDDSSALCTKILSQVEWKVLWKTMERKSLPSNPPSAAWAFKAIAKLGGWTDSKRTGKASWSTIWDGWFKLGERIKGFLLAKELIEANL